MGKLLPFDRIGRISRASAEVSGNATILMFTGIRYERNVAPRPDKPTAPAKPKRKRG